MADLMTETRIMALGGAIMNHRMTNPNRRGGRPSEESLKIFKAYFGLKPEGVLLLSNELVRYRLLPQGAKPKHLLWGLLHLKVYSTECCLAGMAGTTRKTFRGWARKMVRAISQLHGYKVRLRRPAALALLELLLA
jgi:hypothetical protein